MSLLLTPGLFGLSPLGSNQTNSAKAIQTISNNVWQASSASCIGTCQATNVNTTVLLSGTQVSGDINVVATCPASASCAMQSTLETNITNIMSSMAEQNNVTSQILPISFDFNGKNNSFSVNQAVQNNITQVLQSTCQATSNTLNLNTTVVGSNTTDVGGNINITASGSANANCTINNLARMSLFNQLTASTAQTDRGTNTLATVMIVIVIVIVIGAIIAIIIIGPVGVARVVKAKRGKSTPTGPSEGQTLAALLSDTNKVGTTSVTHPPATTASATPSSLTTTPVRATSTVG